MSVRSRLSISQLIMLWFATSFVFGYVHQKHFDNDMAVSRLDVLHSLFNYGKLSIDAYQLNTNDKAYAKGHYYSDKAPGTILLALPGFFLSTIILNSAAVPLDSKDGWLVSSWICVTGSIGFITAFGIVCLFLWLEPFMGSGWALLTAFAICFGSMVFPYATILMSHSVVVGLIAIALYYFRLGWRPPSATEKVNWRWKDFWAGLSCGLAISCEYSATLVVGSILAFACYRNQKRLLYALWGMLPSLAIIGAYNWIATGTPFSLAYSHEVVFTQNHGGLYGISWPNCEHLVALLLVPRQGLLFWSPFLLLACTGYLRLYRSCVCLFWLCYAVPMLHLLVMSGYYTVSAGDTFGSRFLAPMLPLLSLPAGLGAATTPRIGLGLMLTAIAFNSTVTVVDILLPQDVYNPLVDFYIPKLFSSDFTYTISNTIGLRGFLKLVPILITGVYITLYLWRHLRALPSTLNENVNGTNGI